MEGLSGKLIVGGMEKTRNRNCNGVNEVNKSGDLSGSMPS